MTKIVFMGTPEFAVPSLKILLENNYDVVGVVCPPDKPFGRGLQLKHCAVKEFAIQHHLKILQPEKLRNLDFLKELENLQPDIQVVVAFRMLPDLVWKMPKIGTFNLHGSLLPQYRGAAPINHAIINGATKTGVTTFMIDEQIDTGAILLAEELAINENDTAGTIHDALMLIGAQLVLKTIQGLENKTLIPKPQKENTVLLHHAPKIFKDFCLLDVTKTVEEAHNFVRGLSPFPTAYTLYNNNAVKLLKTSKEIGLLKQHEDTKNGTLLSDYKTFIKLKLSNGYLNILELQLPNKKILLVKEVLLGNKNFEAF